MPSGKQHTHALCPVAVAGCEWCCAVLMVQDRSDVNDDERLC